MHEIISVVIQHNRYIYEKIKQHTYSDAIFDYMLYTDFWVKPSGLKESGKDW